MKTVLIVLAFFVFAFSPSLSFADSTYVLPYPSTMPGGVAYKLHLVWEKLMHYWYWGDFGQFEYNLMESDKYLVEAKTLFEYNQYLLGYQALTKSDLYFSSVLPNLQKAHLHGKNTTGNRLLLHGAALKHIEVLTKMEQETPPSFTWTPEKTAGSILPIHQLIDIAIKQRQKDL